MKKILLSLAVLLWAGTSWAQSRPSSFTLASSSSCTLASGLTFASLGNLPVYTLAIDSGPSNVGVLIAGYTSHVTWSSQLSRSVLSFDGNSGGYAASLTGGPVLATSSAPFTVAAWALLSSTSSLGTLYPAVASFTTNFGSSPLTIIASNQSFYGPFSYGSGAMPAAGSGYFGGTTGSWPSLNTWRHLCLSYNGSGLSTYSNFTVYINGGTTAIEGQTQSFGPTSNETCIGCQSSGSEVTIGYVGDVMAWSRKLSGSEVLSLANSANYMLNDPSGNPLIVAAPAASLIFASGGTQNQGTYYVNGSTSQLSGALGASSTATLISGSNLTAANVLSGGSAVIGTTSGATILSGSLGSIWTATSASQGIGGVVFGGSNGVTYTGTGQQGAVVAVTGSNSSLNFSITSGGLSIVLPSGSAGFVSTAASTLYIPASSAVLSGTQVGWNTSSGSVGTASPYPSLTDTAGDSLGSPSTITITGGTASNTVQLSSGTLSITGGTVTSGTLASANLLTGLSLTYGTTTYSGSYVTPQKGFYWSGASGFGSGGATLGTLTLYPSAAVNWGGTSGGTVTTFIGTAPAQNQLTNNASAFNLGTGVSTFTNYQPGTNGYFITNLSASNVLTGVAYGPGGGSAGTATQGAIVNFLGSPTATISSGTLNISSGSTGYTSGGTINVPSTTYVFHTQLTGFAGSSGSIGTLRASNIGSVAGTTNISANTVLNSVTSCDDVAGAWNASNLTNSVVGSGTVWGLSYTGSDVGASWNTSPGRTHVASGVTWSYLGVTQTGSLVTSTSALTVTGSNVLSGVVVSSGTGTVTGTWGVPTTTTSADVTGISQAVKYGIPCGPSYSITGVWGGLRAGEYREPTIRGKKLTIKPNGDITIEDEK